MQKQPFNRSITTACKGLRVFFRMERNGKVQLTIAVVTTIAAVIFETSIIEMMLLIGCYALVMSLEMINTAIEEICNIIQPNYHPSIKVIKDVAAAAVMCSSIASILIGCMMFIPKIINLIS
ncbi:MAG: diacylglycerol kinase [Chitinophagaceae bacterium]